MRKEFSKPTPEVLAMIRRSKEEVAKESFRNMLCPYCHHRVLVVYNDATGHVQAKYKVCGNETIFDLINMRKVQPLWFRAS